MNHDYKAKKNLTDVVWFQEGPGVRNTQYTKQGVKLLNVANLVNGKIDLSTSSRYISEDEAYGKYKHFLADEGDLILASSGIQVDYLHKKMGFIQKEHLPLCMNTSTIRFKSLDENVLNIRFFMYYLKSNYFKDQVARQITGSAQLNFGPSHLKRMKIVVPPIGEQKAICSLLDKLNQVIEAKKEQITELDKLAQSLFYDMFGDPITNEKSWNVKTLKDVGEIITGSTPSTKNAENYNSSDFCFVKPSDIDKDSITRISKTEFYISKSAYNNSRKLPKGSVLVTCIGIVGKTGILEVDATCNQQINAIIPNAYCNSLYIAYSVLLSKRIIEAMANAPVVPIINKGEFSKISIPVPPLPLQQAFAEKVKAIERQKELINQSIKDVQTLFDAKMDYYFGD